MLKKSIITILIILLIPLQSLSQTGKRIYLNDEEINYVLINNEPYVLMSVFKSYNIDLNLFSDVPSVQKEGIYYYQLEGCCKKIGLLNKEEGDSIVKINLIYSKAMIIIRTDRIRADRLITVYICNTKGEKLHAIGLYPNKPYTSLLQAGSYFLWSEPLLADDKINERTKKTPLIYWEKNATIETGKTLVITIDDSCEKTVKEE